MNDPGEHVIERQWVYRQPLFVCLFWTLLMALIAPLCLLGALNIPADAKLRGIRLPPIASLILLWSGVVLTTGLFIMGLVMLWERISKPDKRIALTPEGILMPRTRWRSEEEFLRFDEILDVSLTRYLGEATFIKLHGPQGAFAVARQMLRRADFEEIARLIMDRRNSGSRGANTRHG